MITTLSALVSRLAFRVRLSTSPRDIRLSQAAQGKDAAASVAVIAGGLADRASLERAGGSDGHPILHHRPRHAAAARLRRTPEEPRGDARCRRPHRAALAH